MVGVRGVEPQIFGFGGRCLVQLDDTPKSGARYWTQTSGLRFRRALLSSLS